MSVFRRAWQLIREHPVDTASLILSVSALAVSLITISHESLEHSDSLTSDVIRNAYSDFLTLCDLRAQYPKQSHIFETPENYEWNKALVVQATATELANPEERARLQLEEAALAQRTLAMFEHSYYQWQHAVETADRPRVEFLKAVLDYFTARVLTNPRLLWYWSPAGANLSEHYETSTREYYDKNVRPAGRPMDAYGPFGKAPMAYRAAVAKP